MPRREKMTLEERRAKRQEEKEVSLAGRRTLTRNPMEETSRLLKFAIYLAGGQDAYEAFVRAGFIHYEERITDPVQLETLESWHRPTAEKMARSPRVVAMVQMTRMDPKLILQSQLSALVMMGLDLAFHAEDEKVRQKAIEDLLSRGGLPREAVQYHGDSKKLEKMTGEQLRDRAKLLYEEMKKLAGPGGESGSGL